MTQKSLKEMQKEVDEWISGLESGYWPALSQLAQLVEETGELARELNHLHGQKIPKNSDERRNIEDEMGDIMFVLACLANSMKIDLSSCLEKSLEKLRHRDKDRWKKKK